MPTLEPVKEPGAKSRLPVAPLMIEHRLIERMIAVMRWRVAGMESSRVADIVFVDVAVDFIRTYADRCHHGKEEDILFRDLAQKPLSPEHRRMMGELVAEHVFARKTTERLVEARSRYVAGELSALADIAESLHVLIEFYPKHIANEDREFFLPVMGYFTDAERERMLAEENEFDRRFIHVRYGALVGDWEGASGLGRRR